MSQDQSSPNDSDASRSGRAVPILPRYHRRPSEFYLLWLVALLTYGVGDIATTAVAVFTRPGLHESNPILAAVEGPIGFYWFLTIKFVVFLAMLWLSVRAEERFDYYWPPVATAVLGAVLTVWNLSILATAG